MNPEIDEFVKFAKTGMPQHNKQEAINATKERFGLIRDRSVYFCNAFAVRFCYSKNGSFNNVVLSLSQLLKYDHIPFLAVLICGNADSKIYLANTSMLNKISHSSHELRYDNIRGSFLGSNIIKNYQGIVNDAQHLKELFAIHSGFSRDENISRLVEATSGIKPTKEKFNPSTKQKANILSSIARAKEFVSSSYIGELKQDLDNRVERNKEAVLIASHIENINIRGRLIEYLITSEDKNILSELRTLEEKLPTYDTRNGLGDYVKRFDDCNTYTDVKTKIVYLDSNPKAYNIDKFLEVMSEEDSVFLFYFIGIDRAGVSNSVLCSVYDRKLIDATLLQFHWAGRGTRGVAQFKGTVISEILNNGDFSHDIDENISIDFIQKLLER